MPRSRLLVASLMLLCAGCRSPEVSRQARADAVIAESLKLDAASRPADVLAAADAAAAPTLDTLHAIRLAREEVIADLRNAETTGYKQSRASVTPAAKSHPAFSLDLTPGQVESTGRQLDIAIEGPGFFRIKIPDAIGDGVGYTRDGNLFINNNREVTLGVGDGYKLLPPVVIPPGCTDISISTDGMIQVIKPGQTTKMRAGQISLSSFADPESLARAGGTVLLETPASGPAIEDYPSGRCRLLQGFLESSNVDLARARLRLRFLAEWESTLLASFSAPPAKR